MIGCAKTRSGARVEKGAVIVLTSARSVCVVGRGRAPRLSTSRACDLEMCLEHSLRGLATRSMNSTGITVRVRATVYGPDGSAAVAEDVLAEAEFAEVLYPPSSRTAVTETLPRGSGVYAV